MHVVRHTHIMVLILHCYTSDAVMGVDAVCDSVCDGVVSLMCPGDGDGDGDGVRA